MSMIGRFFFQIIDGIKKRGWLRVGSIILIDTAIGAFSVVSVYIAVFGFPAALQTPNVAQVVAGFTFLCCLSFIVFGTHRGAWRFHRWVKDRDDGQTVPADPPAIPPREIVTIDKRAGERSRSSPEGRSPADTPPNRA